MPTKTFRAALTPSTRPVNVLAGPDAFCFEIANTTFSFVWEDPGIEVVCIGDMSVEDASQS